MVLKIAGITIEELILAKHKKGFMNLSVKLRGNEIIEIGSQPNGVANGWVPILNEGLGFKQCDCGFCRQGLTQPIEKEHINGYKLFLEGKLKDLKLSDEILYQVTPLELAMAKQIVNYIFKKLNVNYKTLSFLNHNKGYTFIFVKVEDKEVIDVEIIRTFTDGIIERTGNWHQVLRVGIGDHDCDCSDDSSKLKKTLEYRVKDYTLSKALA